MYRGKRISLVIPAYNEEKLIRPTLESVPGIIDKIYVVDDGSTDNMANVVGKYMQTDRRVELIQHGRNRGVGQGVITGYKKSSSENYDITVVVGGDNQMPLEQAQDFLDPLINGEADYAKGNRFLIEKSIFEDMPRIRLVGNSIISLLTKLASGYYKIFDMVDGYTAITKRAIDLINWDKAWKGYGYPMDFLIRLNAYGLRVIDIPRRTIYLEGERQSQIKGVSYALKVSPMLIRGFFWRLVKKYIFRDFHPVVFFYFLGLTLFSVGILMGLLLIYYKLAGINVSGPKSILCALLIIMGFQSILFAMLFDMYQEK